MNVLLFALQDDLRVWRGRRGTKGVARDFHQKEAELQKGDNRKKNRENAQTSVGRCI
jgi:hypothetical protein